MDKKYLTLASGRNLSYRVFGNPQGEPLIFFHGFPGSSIQGSLFKSSSFIDKFYLLSFDRPGFADSDFQKNRSLQSLSQDMIESLGLLGIGDVHVMGVSGGSPYAVAMAAHLEGSARSLTLMCPLGPIHQKAFFKILPMKARLLLFSAKRFPKFLGALLSRVLKPAAKSEGSIVEKFAASLCANDILAMSDEKVQPVLETSLQEAFQQGVRGPLEDLRIFMSPWEVDFKKIKAPIKVYHGAEDSIVPSEIGRALGKILPESEFFLIQGEGHYSLPIKCINQILGKI